MICREPRADEIYRSGSWVNGVCCLIIHLSFFLSASIIIHRRSVQRQRKEISLEQGLIYFPCLFFLPNISTFFSSTLFDEQEELTADTDSRQRYPKEICLTGLYFNCGSIVRLYCRTLKSISFMVWSVDLTGASFYVGSRDWHGSVVIVCQASVSITCGAMANMAVVRLQGMIPTRFSLFIANLIGTDWLGLCVSWRDHIPTFQPSGFDMFVQVQEWCIATYIDCIIER